MSPNILIAFALTMFSFLAVPAMCGILGVYRPCSPPSIIPLFFGSCKNDHLHGFHVATGIAFRLFNGVCQTCLFFILSAVVVITLGQVIVYPSVTVELLVQGIQRYLCTNKICKYLDMQKSYLMLKIWYSPVGLGTYLFVLKLLPLCIKIFMPCPGMGMA